MRRESITKRVERGAALLDKHTPGWHRRIDLEKLDLADCDACICGQLALKSRAKIVQDVIKSGRWSPYGALRHWLHKKVNRKEIWPGSPLDFPSRFGFDTQGSDTYAGLERAWARLIRRRLREEAA